MHTNTIKPCYKEPWISRPRNKNLNLPVRIKLLVRTKFYWSWTGELDKS